MCSILAVLLEIQLLNVQIEKAVICSFIGFYFFDVLEGVCIRICGIVLCVIYSSVVFSCNCCGTVPLNLINPFGLQFTVKMNKYTPPPSHAIILSVDLEPQFSSPVF